MVQRRNRREPQRTAPPFGLLPALLLMFIASGASGLIYQQLWLRLLSLVFGVTVQAAATTLAGFLGGLALGGLLAGRIADRVRSPLRLFGMVELGVGLFALATPLALRGVQSAWIALHPLLPDSGVLLTTARFACAGVVLLVPTTLMGASLPVLVRSSLARGGAAGPRIGALYAANTAGALAGTLLCGLLLIGTVGIAMSFRIAAALNLCVGLASLALSRTEAAAPLPSSPANAGGASSGRRAFSAVDRLLLAVFMLSGFVALALEVVWFRALLSVVNATTYAFAFMLAAVLAGIAGGSALMAPVLAARWLRARQSALSALAALLLLLAAVTLLSFSWLGSTYSVHGWLRGVAGESAGTELLLPALAAALAIAPAALLMGLAFPLGLKLFVEGGDGDAARRTGVFCALNLLGGIAGALVAGFVLLPGADLDTSVLVLACASLLGGLLLLIPVARRGPAAAAGLALAGVALFVLAALHVGSPLADAWQQRYPDETLLWHADGVQTSVSIARRPDGVQVMYLDGLHQANDSPEMVRYHALIGHMGLMLHPAPRRVLCIGLGGGVTAGAAAAHTGADVDVVELSDTVVRAARMFFSDVNGRVLDRPNVHLRVDDGRNWLALGGRRYDVITADVIQPRHAGAGSLYSVEYFQLARAALADGGLMVQWVADPGSETWRLIVRTFLAVFPDATLWCKGTLLVGGRCALLLAPADVARKLQDPGAQRIARELGFADAAAILAAFTAGPEDLRRQVGDGPLLTDDRPLLEYYLSLQAAR